MNNNKKPAGNAGKSIMDTLKKVTKKQWMIGGAIATVGIAAPVIAVVATAGGGSSSSTPDGTTPGNPTAPTVPAKPVYDKVVTNNIIDLDAVLEEINNMEGIASDINSGKFNGFKWKGTEYNMADSSQIYQPLRDYFVESRVRYPWGYDQNVNSQIIGIEDWNEIDGTSIKGAAVGEKYTLPSDFPAAPEGTYYEFTVPSISGEEIWVRNISSFKRYPTPWVNDIDLEDETIDLRVRLVTIAPYKFYQDTNIEFKLTIDNADYPRAAGTDVSAEFDWATDMDITISNSEKSSQLRNIRAVFKDQTATSFRDKYVQSVSVDSSYMVRVGLPFTVSIFLREGYTVNGSNKITKDFIVTTGSAPEDVPVYDHDAILGESGELVKPNLKFYDDGTGTGTVRLVNEMAAPAYTKFIYAVTQDSNPPSGDSWTDALPSGIDISSTTSDRIWVMLDAMDPGSANFENRNQKLFSMQEFSPEITDVDISNFFGTNGINYTDLLKYQSADFSDLTAGFEIIDSLELEAHMGTYYEYAISSGATAPADSAFSEDSPKITGNDDEMLWVKLSLTETTKDLYNIVNGDSQPIGIDTSVLDEAKFLFDDQVLRNMNFADLIEWEARTVVGEARTEPDNFDDGNGNTINVDIPSTLPSELTIPGYHFEWRAFQWSNKQNPSAWANAADTNANNHVFAGEVSYAGQQNNPYTGFYWRLVATDTSTHTVVANNTISEKLVPSYGSKWADFVADNAK